MNRRLLLLSLLATMPALVCAQEAKLVNCRTLVAAGYYVGPDEVVLDDMVCQKVKLGAAAAAAAKPQPAKPVPGVVISDTEPVDVVEAAKASTKRVAAAVEANAEKAAATPEATAPVPATPAPAAEDSSAQPISIAEVARANAKRKAELDAAAEKPEMSPEVSSPAASRPVTAASAPAQAVAKPQPVEIKKTEPVERAAAPVPAPASAPARVEPPPPEVAPTPVASAPARSEPAPAPAEVTPPPAAAARPTEEPAPTPTEIVITSAPANEAPAPAPEAPARPAVLPDATPAKRSAPAEVATAPATTPPPSPSEAPAVEKASAFYDANAPKASSNRPAVNLGVVSAPPTAAAVSPDTSPANASAADAPAGAAPAPAEEAAPAATSSDAGPAWPGNPEPNVERERVVETGIFALPKEVSSDPNQPPHSKQITPSAEDGFQEGQRAECRKNITMGGLKGEKLVLGTPGWAANWIEKNQKRMLDLCFSDTPMPGARNYLIVFYTSAPPSHAAEVVNPVAPVPQGSSPDSGVGTFTTSYGSTWHYFFDRNVGVTVNSNLAVDQPQSQPDKVTYATAYTEEGVPVAQHWQGAPKKPIKVNPSDPDVRKESKKERLAREQMEHVADALLSQMVEEIEKL